VFLWNNETDVIHLLHTSQQGKDQGTSRIQEVTSSDGGDRWSRVDILYDKEGTFLRNHPIRSLDGAWLLPVYHTPLGLWDHASQYSEMMRSDDDGKTWEPIAIMAPPPMACVQPSVVRLANDSLVSFFRDRRDVAIYK
jgi:predicted neuraminidase